MIKLVEATGVLILTFCDYEDETESQTRLWIFKFEKGFLEV